MINEKSKSQKKLVLENETLFKASFNSFEELEKFGKNWSFLCKYRFGTGDFSGDYSIYQGNEFQLARASYKEGMMYCGYAPDDTISVVVVMESEGNLCMNKIKMLEGEILIFDASKRYEIVFSKPLTIGVISIKKSFIKKYFPKFLEMHDIAFRDSNLILTTFMQKLQNNSSDFSQNAFINALGLSIDTSKPLVKKLTLGEEKAFEIRDTILQELEKDIDIDALSKRACISNKTTQISFKSLFGFPPKRFTHLLRLNLAHRDLTLKEANETTVAAISLEWGFKHFGRFSKEYREVFGIHPSKTLSSTLNQSNHINSSCIKI